ncbi:DedD [Photobacterium aquae]|uniref:DedD n=1 Tax=Photobacterium aquae TaxID=1195763 RepID=A0A0J1GWY5_9GAMM|nr:SPOR domain-containing protein [Photobacterium aquae]KLV03949.1 DedD [Photobacterium aquae]
MASKFQSRLVGTIILVAIGVIFLPDLFDGKKQHYQEQFASIPLKPQVAEETEYASIPEPEFAEVELPPDPVTVVVSEVDNPYILPPEDANTDEPQPLAQEMVKTDPQPESAPKIGNIDSGWMVQLGVFRNFENAYQLVAKLRKEGFQAHVLPKVPQPGDLARVVVGPDVSKDKLAKQVKELEKLTGLKGQLVRFNPLNP